MRNEFIQFVQYVPPFLLPCLLFMQYVTFTTPLAMLGILMLRRTIAANEKKADSGLWFLGFVLYCLAMAVNVNENVSNGLFLLTICFVLVMIAESIELPAAMFYSNTMLSLTLVHELLFCLFTDFGLESILIFAVLASLIDNVRLESDSDSIAVLLGCLLGVRGVGLTLSGGFFAEPTLAGDELVENWIKFISAPILGVLLFYLLKLSIDQINRVEDTALEES